MPVEVTMNSRGMQRFVNWSTKLLASPSRKIECCQRRPRVEVERASFRIDPNSATANEEMASYSMFAWRLINSTILDPIWESRRHAEQNVQ